MGGRHATTKHRRRAAPSRLAMSAAARGRPGGRDPRRHGTFAFSTAQRHPAHLVRPRTSSSSASAPDRSSRRPRTDGARVRADRRQDRHGQRRGRRLPRSQHRHRRQRARAPTHVIDTRARVVDCVRADGTNADAVHDHVHPRRARAVTGSSTITTIFRGVTAAHQRPNCMADMLNDELDTHRLQPLRHGRHRRPDRHPRPLRAVSRRSDADCPQPPTPVALSTAWSSRVTSTARRESPCTEPPDSGPRKE